jgi:hypothetical protein
MSGYDVAVLIGFMIFLLVLFYVAVRSGSEL